MRGWLALLLLAGCSDTDTLPASGEVWFEEVAAERGLVFHHVSGYDAAMGYRMPEIMGGGVALFDADDDGDLDVYCVQSSWESETARNRLFENTGGAHFRDVSAASGADDAGYGMGVAVGDYDGDGRSDLYVTNLGPNALLRNEGELRFSDVTASASVGHAGWGASAAFVDYDGDGALDIFVVNYLDWAPAREMPCRNPRGELDYCSPQNYASPALDVLYRNLGDGRFEDVSLASGVGTRAATGLGVAVADFDEDGRVDLLVANDGMPDFLWVGNTDGTFTELGLVAGIALDQSGVAKAGMGVAVADIDGDGRLDVLVGNLEGQSDSFFVNEGGHFRDRTMRAGLGATSRPFTRFGMAWADFDNDGWLDLYQANGRVGRQGERFTDDPYAEPNLVLRGLGELRFEEQLPRGGTATAISRTSRGAAFGDLDDDGAIDVVVVNRDGPADLLLNVAPRRGAWVGLDLRNASGAPALGARVEARMAERIVVRHVAPAQSYLSSNDPRIHIGLGAATALTDVVVTWADGTRTEIGELAAGRYHSFRR